jgi:hypothetical protein
MFATYLFTPKVEAQSEVLLIKHASERAPRLSA